MQKMVKVNDIKS